MSEIAHYHPYWYGIGGHKARLFYSGESKICSGRRREEEKEHQQKIEEQLSFHILNKQTKMKKQISIASLLFLAACQTNPSQEEIMTEPTAMQKSFSTPTSSFIPKDSANKMVSSYLASINHVQNDSDVLSFTFNAQQLRRLLDSVAHPDSLMDIQIRLAHSLEYINSGHQNMPAGYNKNALRLLISGVDYKGNTILLNNEVMNHSRPCPNTCPPGTAGAPLYN